MKYKLVLSKDAYKDYMSLDGSMIKQGDKILKRVLENPLPASQGGYGKPLRNKNGLDLSDFLKIKLRSSGLRIVYKLVEVDGQMLVIIIGARSDLDVYKEAYRRINK